MKPRLHKRCPSSEGLREDNVILTARYSTLENAGESLYRRGLNRRLVCITADFDDKSVGIVKVNAASCSARDGATVDRNLIRL